MLRRMQWQVDTRPTRQMTRPHSSAVDHVLCINIPAISHHTTGFSVSHFDVQDANVFENLRTALARTLGQSLGDIHRVHDSITRQINAPDDILDVQEGPQLSYSLGIDHLARKATQLGHRGPALQFGETLLMRSDAQGTVA